MRKFVGVAALAFLLTACGDDYKMFPDSPPTCLNYLTTGEQQQILCPPGFDSGDGIYLKDGKWTSVQ